MKKIVIIILLSLLFCNTSVAESYYFKECKLSSAVSGNYIINLDKNIIEVLYTLSIVFLIGMTNVFLRGP